MARLLPLAESTIWPMLRDTSTVTPSTPPHALEPEPKIADIVHRLLRDRSIDREFGLEDNLRDVGLTSLDMVDLVLSVECAFDVQIPEAQITPANFRSIAAIDALLSTLRTAQH